MCQPKSPWWIPGQRVWDSSKTDYFPVRLCKTCNKVWEVPLKFTKEAQLVIHNDFPTYGLKREICYACKKRKNKKSSRNRF